MTMAAQIRRVMSAEAALSASEIVTASGVSNAVVSEFLCSRAHRGEVVKSGETGNYLYQLNADYVRSRAAPTRKLQGFKAERRERERAKRSKAERAQLRAIADKARQAAPTQASVHALALSNYVTISEHLRTHVQENVGDIESDPMLCMLITMHERAEKLLHICAG